MVFCLIFQRQACTNWSRLIKPVDRRNFPAETFYTCSGLRSTPMILLDLDQLMVTEALLNKKVKLLVAIVDVDVEKGYIDFKKIH
jgi:hypothetical protein